VTAPSDPLASALALLPHGDEFRFVDRLVELSPGKFATARYTLRGDEVFLRGHFPSDPMLPGVLLIEAGAQLTGIVAQTDPEIRPLANLRLTAIRSAKILGTAHPGESVLIKASITGRLAALVQAHAEAIIDNRVIMTSEIVLGGTPALESGGSGQELP
jgi:3-hydroxymyristoyl/3-hydroxydecanoyl-(acyl carrier protein) dehydratase